MWKVLLSYLFEEAAVGLYDCIYVANASYSSKIPCKLNAFITKNQVHAVNKFDKKLLILHWLPYTMYLFRCIHIDSISAATAKNSNNKIKKLKKKNKTKKNDFIKQGNNSENNGEAYSVGILLIIDV